jgi:hypothetical protein
MGRKYLGQTVRLLGFRARGDVKRFEGSYGHEKILISFD